MLFFKFQRSDNLALSMLRKGEIYFAAADELNDASECRPRYIFKGSEELWQRLADYVLSHACFDSKELPPDKEELLTRVLALSNRIGSKLKKEVGNRDLGLEELEKLFSRILEQTLQGVCQGIDRDLVLRLVHVFLDVRLRRELKEDKYIASFTQTATNATMWGHYADAERGFVIVYESTDGSIHVRSPINVLHGCRPSKSMEGVTEIGIYKDDHLKLQEVRYGRRPPKVNAFHRLIHKFHYSEEEDRYDVPSCIGADAEAKQECLVGLVKYSDWRYEREIRAFFPIFGSILPDARVLQIGLSNVKGVIFGPRMSCENKARVILCCHLLVKSVIPPQGAGYEFMFFQASQTIDRFSFQILPAGMLDTHYFAPYLPFTPMQKLDVVSAKRIQEAADLIVGSSTGRKSRRIMG